MINPVRTEYDLQNGLEVNIYQVGNQKNLKLIQHSTEIRADDIILALEYNQMELLYDLLGQELGKVSNLVLPGHGPGVHRDHVVG